MREVLRVSIINKTSLEKMAKNKIHKYKGRIGKDAIELIARALTEQAERTIEFSFIETRKENRSTIKERNARQGIQEARYSYISGLVAQLGHRVEAIQKEIEDKSQERKKLFGSGSK